MQISFKANKLIPIDTTIDSSKTKMSALSIHLDGERYALIKRLGRVFERTNKDIFIDLLDIWLTENISYFPESEQEAILEMVKERKQEHSINHRKPA